MERRGILRPGDAAGPVAEVAAELPPACLVRSASDIDRVLRTGAPACLLSGPAAASFLGAATWGAMIAGARARHPRAAFTDLLDCGDESGRALEALRLGRRGLVLDPAAPGRAGIAERAAGLGARLLASPPPSLDLGEPGLAAARLEAWLFRP